MTRSHRAAFTAALGAAGVAPAVVRNTALALHFDAPREKAWIPVSLHEVESNRPGAPPSSDAVHSRPEGVLLTR